jgi:hypothetical protein
MKDEIEERRTKIKIEEGDEKKRRMSKCKCPSNANTCK